MAQPIEAYSSDVMSMNRITTIPELLRQVLTHPTGGITGLVDDLLMLCFEHHLQLDWQANRFRVRSSGGDWEELLEVPLRKSVFRAVLARVAVLCNERNPNSVSPYGGQGELSIGEGSPAVYRITFANTPGEQKLELTCASSVEGAECSLIRPSAQGPAG
jgi:hypothetical protein